MALVKRVSKNTQQNQITYFSDFITSFDVIYNRDLQITTNEQDVMQSLHNLIKTNIGERLYQPTFGCGLQTLLFEPITPQTENAIKDRIQTAIENFEPRAKLLEVITQGAPDENSYYVSITFMVINKQDPITMEFVLVRIR